MNDKIDILKSLESYWNWDDEALGCISALKGCQQSKIHHAEGDVYVHTQMVTNEMEQALKTKNFNQTQKDTLLLSALLHDIAKPDTTYIDEESKDWVSPGHAKLGEKLARELLFKKFPFLQREEISALVRYHGLPIWAEVKPNPDKAIIEASLRCNLNELSLLAECDFKGRICQDLDDMLLRIEIFKERAEKLNCLNQPYPFANDWSRLHCFRRDSYHAAEIWEPKKGWLTIMCGLPGSGKNTWLRKNWTGAIVELDSIRRRLKIPSSDTDGQGTVMQEAKEELRKSFRTGADVAWNATSITELQRAPLIDLAMDYGMKIRIVYIDCSVEESIRKNKERPEKEMVPEKAIINMSRKFDMPTLKECHKLEVVR